MNDFEKDKIHGYTIEDLAAAWDKIRLNDGHPGEMIEVLTPTQYKAVGRATFVFDGENWVLKSVR